MLFDKEETRNIRRQWMSTAIIKPRWSFFTIVIMVFGFILWWPLGLGMLAYIIWGENFGGSAEKAEKWVDGKKEWARKQKRHYKGRNNSSGNEAFDEYRDEQFRRLDEERRRLDKEVNEFSDYMDNLQKARDREEFDRYMDSRSQQGDGFSQSTTSAKSKKTK